MKRVAILFLAFAAVSFTAQAQSGQGRMSRSNSNPENGKSPRVQTYRFNNSSDRMIPDLSQEQQEAMKKLRLEMTKETTSIRNQLSEKRARLNTLQSADNADMSAINNAIDEIAALQAQQMKARASYHVQTRALLNDDQKIAFDNQSHRNFNFEGRREQVMMWSSGMGNADADLKELNDLGEYGELEELEPSIENGLELEAEE